MLGASTVPARARKRTEHGDSARRLTKAPARVLRPCIWPAGFDAHKKDEINFRYIGITERDYEASGLAHCSTHVEQRAPLKCSCRSAHWLWAGPFAWLFAVVPAPRAQPLPRLTGRPHSSPRPPRPAPLSCYPSRSGSPSSWWAWPTAAAAAAWCRCSRAGTASRRGWMLGPFCCYPRSACPPCCVPLPAACDAPHSAPNRRPPPATPPPPPLAGRARVGLCSQRGGARQGVGRAQPSGVGPRGCQGGPEAGALVVSRSVC